MTITILFTVKVLVSLVGLVILINEYRSTSKVTVMELRLMKRLERESTERARNQDSFRMLKRR